MIELLPSKASYRPADAVRIDVSPAPPPASRLVVSELQTPVLTCDVVGTQVHLGTLPTGAYGLDLWGPGGGLLGSSAIDVRDNPLDRPRYGFQAHHGPGVDVDAGVAFAQRLHLNAVQFYDWAWRYTELVGPDNYQDTLGNEVSLATLRSFIERLGAAGAQALGYVALYAIPRADRERYQHLELLRAGGEPYGFGDGFLTVADPSAPEWVELITSQIARAASELGWHGFHLDQYGWPKQALRRDGTATDLTETLPALVDQVAATLPDRTLIFNNVNGFPLQASARARQAALYCEVWAPRTDLADLADLVAASRAAGPLPVIVSAYLSAFASEQEPRAADAARLAMATIFSSGASHLLAGEAGHVLTDPYYPRNVAASPDTVALLARWYDALVRYGDLLIDPAIIDVTGAYAGTYNGDVVVGDGVGNGGEVARVSTRPDPGCVWLRVMRAPAGMVIHLINLTGQDETGWDAGKNPIAPVDALQLRLRRLLPDITPVYAADPDRPGPMVPLTATPDGDDQVTELPPLGAWMLVYVPTPPARKGPQ